MKSSIIRGLGWFLTLMSGAAISSCHKPLFVPLSSQQVIFLPQEAAIAVLGDHNQVLVKNSTSGDLIRSFELRGLDRTVFLPDQVHALLHSLSRDLRLCDLSSDNPCTSFTMPSFATPLAALLPSANRLLVLTSDGFVLEFNPQDGSLQSETALFPQSALLSLPQAGTFMGSDQVVVAQDSHILVFSYPQGVLLQTLSAHSADVLSLQALVQGSQRFILSSSVDETAILWSYETISGRYVLTTRYLGHTSRVLQAQFSPDAQRVITCGEDHTARIFQRDTGFPESIYRGHEDRVQSCALSQDGTVAVSVSLRGDNPLKVWKLSTTPIILGETQTYSGAINSASFSSDGKSIVTTGRDGFNLTAKVWIQNADGTFGTFPRILGGTQTYSQDMESASFSPDGRRIVTTGTDGTLGTPAFKAKVWRQLPDGTFDLNPRTLGTTMTYTSKIRSASFSSDGRRILTVGQNGNQGLALVWTEDDQGNFSNTVVGGVQTYNHAIFSASFSPDGRWIVTTGQDFYMDVISVVKVWSQLPDGTFTLVQFLGESQTFPGGIASAVFSPDGKHILTAGLDQSKFVAKVWSKDQDGMFTLSPQILGATQTYSRVLFSAVFSADGTEIVTAGADAGMEGRAKVWSLNADGKINLSVQSLGGSYTYDNNPISASFSPDGQYVVTTGFDGGAPAVFRAKIWVKDQSQLIAAFSL